MSAMTQTPWISPETVSMAAELGTLITSIVAAVLAYLAWWQQYHATGALRIAHPTHLTLREVGPSDQQVSTWRVPLLFVNSGARPYVIEFMRLRTSGYPVVFDFLEEHEEMSGETGLPVKAFTVKGYDTLSGVWSFRGAYAATAGEIELFVEILCIGQRYWKEVGRLKVTMSRDTINSIRTHASEIRVKPPRLP
jgi:hypothetical protein